MKKCPNCNHLLHTAESADADSTCRDWQSIARISTIAEAGYLAHSLQSQGLAARVVESPSFNAAGGARSQGYVLQVDPFARDEALAFLEAEALEANSEGDFERDPRSCSSSIPAGYRIVGLLALASFAGFWMGGPRQPLAVDTPRVPARELADRIDSVGRPLETVDPMTGNQHRIQYDAVADAIVIQQKASDCGDWQNAYLFPLSELR